MEAARFSKDDDRRPTQLRPLLTAGVILLAGWCATTAGPTPHPIPKPDGSTWSPHEHESLERIQDLLRSGRYERAEKSARELLERMETSRGRGSIEWAEVVDILVYALERGGKAAASDAEALARDALAVKTRAFGARHERTALTMARLGMILYEKGDYKSALRLQKSALDIREERLGPSHAEVAWSLTYLGIIMHESGDWAAAKKLHRRALEIRERVLGPDHYDVSWSLNNLAVLHEEQGDFELARPLYERAVAIRESALGRHHPDVAAVLNNKASLLQKLGDFGGAKEAYERTIAIQEATLGSRHPRLATTLLNLGYLLAWSIGDYSGARPFLESAIGIYKEKLGPESLEVAWGLIDIGYLLTMEGNYTEARSHYEQALAIREKVLGREHPLVAEALCDVSALLRRMRRFDEARAVAERAVAIVRAGEPAERDVHGFCRASLARALRDTGEFEKARRLYIEILSEAENLTGPGHPRRADLLTEYATTLLYDGEIERALDLALEAEKISRDHLRGATHGIPERLALRYSATRTRGLDVALSAGLASTDPEMPRRLWEPLIRSRAVVFQELANHHKAVVDMRHQYRQLQAVRSELLALVRAETPDADSSLRQGPIEKMREQAHQLEKSLAHARQSLQRAPLKEEAGLNAIAASLERDRALVAFVRYEDHRGRGGEAVRNGSAEVRKLQPAREIRRGPVPSYLAFVLRGGESEPRIVALGETASIDSLISAWRHQVGRRPTRTHASVPEAEAACRRAGVALRQALWDPIVPWIREARTVHIVPDGEINHVSFAALPSNGGGYLIETGGIIHYLLAERDLVKYKSAAPGGEGLLAVGGPAFDDMAALGRSRRSHRQMTAEPQPPRIGMLEGRGSLSTCGDFRSIHFHTLPAAEQETERVVALWREVRGRQGGSERASAGRPRPATEAVVHLTGSRATEAEFKRNASGRRILHIATHGFFLGGRCPSAGDEQARGIGSLRPSPGAITPHVTGESPLVLTGLAFAGANHRDSAEQEEEDGVLTAEEIAEMDLDGVEWAVLSACDTGLGEVLAGEGVIGLRRSFQLAGTDTIIMSLWTVDDEWTRRWMESLYESRLLKGLGTAVAVRDAALAALRQQRELSGTGHPFYWGSFVAAGSWN